MLMSTYKYPPLPHLCFPQHLLAESDDFLNNMRTIFRHQPHKSHICPPQSLAFHDPARGMCPHHLRAFQMLITPLNLTIPPIHHGIRPNPMNLGFSDNIPTYQHMNLIKIYPSMTSVMPLDLPLTSGRVEIGGRA